MALLEINWQPSRRELKQFAGIWFPLACAFLCWLLFRMTKSWQAPAVLGYVGFVLAVTGFIVPAVARYLFLGWMIAAFPIGWTVSHILMGTIYYGLITPMGLIMRWCGRDSMGRRFDHARESYWEPHVSPKDKQQYFRQY